MSCITVCFTYSLRMAIFWTDISQGSVATCLGCGRVFMYHFVTNFLLSLKVKEFWKSVNIWWSYGQELGVLFFWLTVYIDSHRATPLEMPAMPCEIASSSVIPGGGCSSFSFHVAAATVLSASTALYCCCCCCRPMLLLSADWTALHSADQ